MQRILIFLILICGSTGISRACDDPFLLSAYLIGTDSMRIDWYNFDDNVESFQLDVQEGTAPPSNVPLYSGILESNFRLKNLKSGTLYTIYVRSVCPSGMSNWISMQVRTAYMYKDNCNIHFPIQDNSCAFSGREKMLIIVDSTAIEGITNPRLAAVSLIVDHPWPSDLKASLIAPSGQVIPLFDNLALGYPDIGNPTDSSCTEALVLRDESCRFIQSSSGPFIGEFKPIGSLQSIPTDEIIGTWKLDICDDSPGDIGHVFSMELRFSSADCRPVVSELKSFTHSEVNIHLANLLSSDTIIFKYGLSPLKFTDTSGYFLDTIYTSAISDTTITLSHLNPGEAYTFYSYRRCQGNNSSVTCPMEVRILCDRPTAMSHFNDYPISTGKCSDESLTSGIWYQDSSTLYAWKIGKGPTNTQLTGPESSPYGNDNYIFFDASDYSCGRIPAILNSSCFNIPAPANSCGMAFDYSMNGNEISSLTLRIMVDESMEWDTLFHRTGDQGAEWHHETISLKSYAGSTVNLQFIAGPSIGARGDIALDNIVMMGPVPIHRYGYLVFPDQDNDNYGYTQDSVRFCRSSIPSGFTDVPGDCDDTHPAINPGVPELPCNLIDDNCNGVVDEVQQGPTPIFTVVESRNPTCKGIDDGILEIEVENYNNYHIRWNTGDTTERLENIPAGVYYFEFTTSTGCLFRSQFYELNNVSDINAMVTSIKKPTCNGINDGAITVSSGGGVQPYTYLWNNGKTGSTLDSIGPGIYSVTISDASGCRVFIDSILIRDKFHNKAHIDLYKAISCYGNSDGRLVASLQDTTVQSYRWNTGDTTRIARNLPKGKYTCTMRFMNDCTITSDTFYLGQPDSLYVSKLNIVSPTCSNINDGLIIAKVGGGTQPYVNRLFTQDTFYVGPVFNALKADTYTLVVRDINNCTLTMDSIKLKQKSDIVVNAHTTHTRCPLSGDGGINVEASGGTAPFQYIWSNVGLDDNEIDGLSPGIYTLTVVDRLGCKSEEYAFTIEQGMEKLDVGLELIDPIYCGDSSGSITTTILNGKDNPVEYNWSNGTVHNNSFLSDTLLDIPVGNYTVTATDANGCVGISRVFSLKEIDTLVYKDILIDQLHCLGDSSGRIEIVLSYYNAPIEFDWNHLMGDSVASNLPAGIYQLTMTDAAGCTVTTPSIKIFKSNPMLVQHFVSELSNKHFEIEVKVNGGLSPYNISWEDDTTTSFVRSNLPEGEYFYTLEDAEGCAIDSSIYTGEATRTTKILKNDIVIYPNPTQKSFSMSNLPALGNKANLKIYSTQGVLLKETTRYFNVDISNFPPGIYYLVLRDAEIIYRAKLIKLNSPKQ